MARIDWAGLLRRGLAPQAMGGLGLDPRAFWALSPVELRLMLGEEPGGGTIRRAGLQALMARFPDQQGEKGGGDGGKRDDRRADGGAGDEPWGRGADDGGL